MPQTITGRSAFLSLLKDEGVSYLFGNPGTTELPIMDALSDHPEITYVLGLQEAVVVAMADGYARASNQLAACNVHVAPGLGNAMGSLYNAKWYGAPVLITAGQQEQGHGLTEPLLYDPLLPIAAPLVKWAVEVNRLADLPRIVRRAAKVALTPPSGPVFISLPGDILNDEADLDLGRRTRVEAASRPADEVLEKLAARLMAARNPVIVCGHEINTRDALAEAARFAELLGAAVYQQTVPYTAQYFSEHALFMGALSRNQQQVREKLQAHDLLIALGGDVLRMSVWNPLEPLPEGLPVIQIALRDWELGKNYAAEIAVKADVKETLSALCALLAQRQSAMQKQHAEQRTREIRARNWSVRRETLRAETRAATNRHAIDPRQLMLHIVDALPADAVVVDEGLTASASLLSFLAFKDRCGYYGLASGGIGFAVAGAVGIQLALPARRVFAIIGDGSSLYNIQALWTAAHFQLPITYIIANNRGYRILKERLLAFQGNDNFIGMNFHRPEIDFTGLAQSLGVAAQRVEKIDDIAAMLRWAMDSKGPCLLDVAVDDGFG